MDCLPDKVRELLEIALVTECREDALIMLNAFFDARPDFNRERAFEVLESYGPRFMGLNALETLELTGKNINNNTLYITQPRALKYKGPEYKIRVMFYRELE